LSRPLFLLGGVALLVMGARDAPSIDVARLWIAQAMVSLVQLTAHYVNEYADVEADGLIENRTLFSGGSGVLVEGALSPAVALRAAVITSVAAVAPAIVLASYVPEAAMVGALALAISWAYSMPPFRLLGTGWGEALTSVTSAGMVPIVGVLAMGGTPSAALWWAIAALVPAHVAMMLVFEIPDIETDRRAGKRVLAVRLGRPITETLIVVLYAIAFGVAALRSPRSAVAIAVALVCAISCLLGLKRDRWWPATAGAVAVLVFLTLGFTIA
jgi:1,4-dihydroxy-2-naphthoate octaprenyltransferase